jgi:Ca2+-transporting ATPase
LPFETDLTIIYATFLAFNWWNLFNIRVLGKGHSLFYNIGKSKNFLIGSAIIFVGTICTVQFGGEVFETHPLSLSQWVWIFLATSPVVIIKELWFCLSKK